MINARYTIVLKTLLDDPECKKLIDKALSTYPLITPKNPGNLTFIPTREEINKKLLDYYKYREIGFETFARFVDELEIAMNEIMPYYNQKFNSEDIINGIEDIFGNLDVQETYEEQRSGTSSNGTTSNETLNTKGSETDSTSLTKNASGSASSEGSDSSTSNNTMNTNGKQVTSDTPQNSLTITAANIDSITYANDVKWNKDQSTSNGTTSGSTTSSSSNESVETNTGSSSISKTDESKKNSTSNIEGSTSDTISHTLHRKGNQGVNTYAHDMLEFRQFFLNIIQEIIHDPRITELFMNAY